MEIADQARLQALLLDSLGIERVHLVGPSVGGLIALSFACQFPERVRSFISIGSGYRASIEHRLSLFEQILAIELDPDFQGGDYYRGPAPKKGWHSPVSSATNHLSTRRGWNSAPEKTWEATTACSRG